MKQELTWFQLRFPRDLAEPSVLAALSAFSGVSHCTRLVFDLTGDVRGITHRLAVSPHAADLALADLRAAIPSLRLDETPRPELPYRRRLMWQLAPRTSPFRVEPIAASAASLLAGLFPLQAQEAIRLIWHVRAAPRPALVMPPELARDGYLHAMRGKLAGAGLAAYGELRVQASSAERVARLMHRTAASSTIPTGTAKHSGCSANEAAT